MAKGLVPVVIALNLYMGIIGKIAAVMWTTQQ